MSNAPAADPQVSRRFALKAIGATLGLGAFAVALAPVAEWASEQNVEDFLQKHYKELTPEQKRVVFDRLEAEAKEEYGVDVKINDHRPMDGVKFGYALNLTEWKVTAGIWAAGLMLLTVFLKVAVAVFTDRMHRGDDLTAGDVPAMQSLAKHKDR